MTSPASHTTVPFEIVGAGPVALSMALRLARYGVGSVLVEREARTSEYSRAPGIHVRTRQIFRQWGIEDRLLDAGILVPVIVLHSAEPGARPLLSVVCCRRDRRFSKPVAPAAHPPNFPYL